MNYKESKKILAEIKKAKKILLNCHRGPDPDSIGCALAMYQVLIDMGKEVKIVCPSVIKNKLEYLKNSEKIETINFKKFDFSSYDLFITLDTANLYQVTGSRSIPRPEIKTIVIDHHKTNERYGDINLIKAKMSSNAELLYLVFGDWGVEISKNIATALLTGIIADTGVFRYPGTSAQTFRIATELIDKGADKEKIISAIYFNIDFNVLKLWGEILHTMQIDEEGKFAWSAVPYEKYSENNKPADARSMAAGMFVQSVKGANFGIVMVEESKKNLGISIRSRKGYDISGLSKVLGGGGHESAAGAKVEGLEFDKAVEKVLRVARKFAKEK